MEFITAFTISWAVLLVTILAIVLLGIRKQATEKPVDQASFDSLVSKRHRQILAAKLVVYLIPITCLIALLSICG